VDDLALVFVTIHAAPTSAVTILGIEETVSPSLIP
jgi:hypothetical protein